MQFNSFKKSCGTNESKSLGFDSTRLQLLFGYDLTKLNVSQLREAFVVLNSHLSHCSSCQVKSQASEAAKVSASDSDLTVCMFGLAALFNEEHCYHTSWAEIEKFKQTFEAAVKPQSLETSSDDESSSASHGNVSLYSSGSCFSYKVGENLTYQTLVSRSKTEKVPTPSQLSESQTQSSNSSDAPVPGAAVVLPKNQSAKKQKLNRRSTLKSFFQKSSKKTQTVNETSAQDRKANRIARFFKDHFDVLRHKKCVQDIETLTAHLTEREPPVVINGYRPRTVNCFTGSLIVLHWGEELASVLDMALGVKPHLVEKAALDDAKTVPKLICWYGMGIPQKSVLVENMMQLLQPNPLVIASSVTSWKLLEPTKQELVPVKVARTSVATEKCLLPLPLSFYVVSLSPQLNLNLVKECYRRSFESKILLNEYGFQNYSSCDELIGPAAAGVSAAASFVADEHFGLDFCLPVFEGSVAELADGSSLASTIVNDSQDELAVLQSASKMAKVEPLHQTTTLVEQSFQFEPFELPDVLEKQRTEIAAIVASSVAFPDISDKVLKYCNAGKVSPFLVEYDTGEILDIIQDFEFAPVTFCSNGTGHLCEVQDYYHVTVCLHETPCYLKAPHSVATVVRSMDMPDSMLYRFGVFVNLAYPRYGFAVLEAVGFRALEEVMEHRWLLLNAFQTSCVQWLLRHRQLKLYMRQSLEFASSLDSTKPEQAMRRIDACSPEDAEELRTICAALRCYAIDDFVVRSLKRYKVFLKQSEAREFMMHQTYMGIMALLLDPSYDVPVDFKAVFIDGLDNQIEQSYRNLSLKGWSELSWTTESIDAASITFLWVNGVVRTENEHDEMFRRFSEEINTME